MKNTSQSRNVNAPGYKPRMMPGQEPYTDEEWTIVSKWIHDAASGDPGEDGEADVLRERDKSS